MVILSKEVYYRNICKDTPCSLLHLWSSNCLDGLSWVIYNVLIGSPKFFGPIYALNLLLNWKKLNTKYIISQLKAYLRSIVFGTVFGILLFGSLCITSNLQVESSYYNVMRSGLICGISILIESQENKDINLLTFFNQAVEGMVNVLTYESGRKRPRWLETLAFMCISSGLMFLFKTHPSTPKFTHLWFYRERSLFENYEHYTEILERYCRHKTPCLEHAYKGAIKYFCMGYIIEIIRKVSVSFNKLISKPFTLIKVLFSKKHLLFGLFFGGFTFFYRRITCHLAKRDKKEQPVHAMIAGFLAGVMYYFRPNIQISITGFTTILQLLWERFRMKYKLPNNIPYSMLLYCCCTAMLLHFRFHIEDCCPKYTRNMLNIVTNNLAEDVYKNALWMIHQSDEVFRMQSNLSKLQ